MNLLEAEVPQPLKVSEEEHWIVKLVLSEDGERSTLCEICTVVEEIGDYAVVEVFGRYRGNNHLLQVCPEIFQRKLTKGEFKKLKPHLKE